LADGGNAFANFGQKRPSVAVAKLSRKRPCLLIMESLPGTAIRQLAATDTDAFSALRREVTSDNPVPMGLTLQEGLSRTHDGQLMSLSLTGRTSEPEDSTREDPSDSPR
jgi:hypothetical protein